jgi:hypothetical protein
MIDKNMAAGISSQYLKRFLENFYNNLSKSGALDKFKNLDSASQHILELLAYFTTTSLGERLEDGGFLKKIFSEILKDAPSEISKRVYNNLEQSPHSAENQQGENKFIDNFLGLEKENLISLIDWVDALDETKKKNILKHLKSFSSEKLADIAQYSPEEKGKLEKFLESITPESFSKKATGKIEEVLDDINAFLKSKL